MGGYGSGREPEKYFRTVEECHSIDISKMVRGEWIGANRRTSGIIRWHRAGKEIASVGFEARVDIHPPYLRLYYSLNRTDHIDYKVYLTTSRPKYGGIRYWFLCPTCEKRFGRLYLGWVQRYFTCRICQRLTYSSCRESHDLDALISKIQQQSGKSRAEVLRSLKEFSKGQ